MHADQAYYHKLVSFAKNKKKTKKLITGVCLWSIIKISATLNVMLSHLRGSYSQCLDFVPFWLFEHAPVKSCDSPGHLISNLVTLYLTE